MRIRQHLAVARGMCATAIGAGLITACGTTAGAAGQHASPARTAVSARPASTPTAPSTTPSARRGGPLPVAPGQGQLAQTRVRPRAHGPAFRAMVTDLWLAVRTGRPSLARQAFFPLAAYKQVKAIYDAAGDWRTRLWLDFALDVRAAHR